MKWSDIRSCTYKSYTARLCLLLFSLGAPSVASAQDRVNNLQRSFNEFLKDTQARYALTSLCVLDASTGKVLYEHNQNTGFAPASTLKTITAATAFSILGKDFTYKTTLSYSGTIDSRGNLNGSIIIKGSGDPSLASWRYEKTKEGKVLDQWVNAIRKAGIRSVNGNIIGDDSLWPSQTIPEGWIWQDIGNYYGAGASGLSWRENQFDVKLSPGAGAGSQVKVLRSVPEMPYIQLVNELKTGNNGSGDNAYAFLAPYSTFGYIRGTWGLDIAKEGISVSTPDPAYDAAYHLQDTLDRIGIKVSGLPTTGRRMLIENKSFPPITELAVITSPTLSDLIYWFCKKSVNLYGEALIKTLASQAGKPGTTGNGAAAVVSFWAGKGIDRDALNIIDGSGLSPGTRVTASAMAAILFQAQKESWFPEYLYAFPEYNGMKLKSGTINDVSAFAGYHTDSSGNKYVIVIGINNYSGSGINRKLFKVLDALK